MNKDEMAHILEPETFTPFVLTTKGGFSLAVSNPRDTLLGLAMVVIKHQGRLYQIPLSAIDHIDETGDQLG